METRHRSKVVLDASTGYAGGFEKSTNVVYTHSDLLENNREGKIFAYYIVPAFNAYTLEWYDLDGEPTDTYTTAVELSGQPVIRKQVFDPEGQGPEMSTLPAPYLDPNVFPSHKSENDRERLNWYWLNPTDAAHNSHTVVDSSQSTTTWAGSSPGDFSWKIDTEHSIDNGWYCDLKIGYKVAMLGFGVEGNVKILVNTKTQTGVEAKTTLKNQEPLNETDPARVTSFTVEGYWLKPASNGYWIPKNRVGMGDSPWFITYRVTDYWP